MSVHERKKRQWNADHNTPFGRPTMLAGASSKGRASLCCGNMSLTKRTGIYWCSLEMAHTLRANINKTEEPVREEDGVV